MLNEIITVDINTDTQSETFCPQNRSFEIKCMVNNEKCVSTTPRHAFFLIK